MKQHFVQLLNQMAPLQSDQFLSSKGVNPTVSATAFGLYHSFSLFGFDL